MKRPSLRSCAVAAAEEGGVVPGGCVAELAGLQVKDGIEHGDEIVGDDDAIEACVEPDECGAGVVFELRGPRVKEGFDGGHDDGGGCAVSRDIGDGEAEEIG